MGYDYFYEEQSEQFVFYRIPKNLFVNEHFRSISTDAKVLYGLLLDRVALSSKNGWLDQQGRVYIFYTLQAIQKALGCSEKSAIKYLTELENCKLIERVRQGQGKPTIIYVKNFIDQNNLQVKNCNNYRSGPEDFTGLDQQKLQGNNTELNNTEFSNNNLILSAQQGLDDGMDERVAYRDYFMEQLEVENLLLEYPYDRDCIEGMVELILDTVCSKRDSICIAGDEKPMKVVQSRFMKLDGSHIRYVLDCMKETNTKVRSIKQYLLAALYNAPVTIGSYYQALVNHDRATGKI